MGAGAAPLALRGRARGGSGCGLRAGGGGASWRPEAPGGEQAEQEPASGCVQRAPSETRGRSFAGGGPAGAAAAGVAPRCPQGLQLRAERGRGAGRGGQPPAPGARVPSEVGALGRERWRTRGEGPEAPGDDADAARPARRAA